MKIKKLLSKIGIIAILVSVFPFWAIAEDGGNQTLYAGKDTPVGEIIIDDSSFDYLYVTYELDEGYCLLETHLHIGEDTPMAGGKIKNPVPGQFEYSEEHDCVSSYTYEIPWDGVDFGETRVAAHAVVGEVQEELCEVWQIGDKEEIIDVAYTNYADEFNWPNATSDKPGDSLVIEEPPFQNPFIVGLHESSDFPWNSNFDRGYAIDINVEWEGSLPFGGILTVSWAPGASALEEKVVSGDGITSKTFTAHGAKVTGEGWFNNWKLYKNQVEVDQLSYGTHTINLAHTKGDGTAWDYVRLEAPCISKGETAWAGNIRFNENEKGNWATYFTYDIQAPANSLLSAIYDGNCDTFGTNADETLTFTFTDNVNCTRTYPHVIMSGVSAIGTGPLIWTCENNVVTITSTGRFNNPRPKIGDIVTGFNYIKDLLGNSVIVPQGGIEVTAGNVVTNLSCFANEFPSWISSRVADGEFDEYDSYENLVLTEGISTDPTYVGNEGVIFYKSNSNTFEGYAVFKNEVPQLLQIKLEGLGSIQPESESNEWIGLIGSWWDTVIKGNIGYTTYLTVKDQNNVLGYVIFDQLLTNQKEKVISLTTSYNYQGTPTPTLVNMTKGNYIVNFVLTENVSPWRGAFTSVNPLEFTIE
ncbi:hypothetical protein K0B04_00945 [Patescibacteria group bacterium]|nr:hypothetical protein [Patescibacteria group bacterium]